MLNISEKKYPMKQFILTFFAVAAVVVTQAQKLPNKQEVSLRAPVNIKIDGKLDEWGDFKADNSATGLLYTIANDDQNIYLVTQTKISGIRDKMWSGGMSLIFKKTAGAGQNAVSRLTYSALSKDRIAVIAGFMKGTITNIKEINNAITASVKTIAIENFDGVNEDTISIYNDYGIAAASYMKDKNTYSCEIAIPLKYLKSSVNAQSGLKYTLQVNGMSFGSITLNMNGKQVDGNSVSLNLKELINNANPSQDNIEPGAIPIKELINDTNVSGEYTLAK